MATKEYIKKLKELNKQKKYIKKQILGSKFRGKYIDTYFYHYDLWNDKLNKLVVNKRFP